MRRSSLLAFCLFVLSINFAAFAQTINSESSARKRAQAVFAKAPLSFERNDGQAASPIKFLGRGPGYSVFLGDTEAVLTLGSNLRPASAGQTPTKAVLRMQVAGSNPHAAAPSGLEELPGKTNYFLESDPATWRTNIPTFARVKYTNAYPGIDLVYHGNQRQLEYDWIISPGADPHAIRIHFEGARSLAIDSNGDLVIGLPGGQLHQHKPVVSQPTGEEPRAIPGKFVLLGNNDVGFAVGLYDRHRTLVIDPVLQYSTYLGGSQDDLIGDITLDSAGNIYVVGETDSPDFPGRNFSSPDRFLFVTKLNPAGTQLIYTSLVSFGPGPAAFESHPTKIAVDSSGSAYVTGMVESPGYLTVNAYQKFLNGGSIFLSNDSGATWSAIGTGIRDNIMQTVVADPSNPSVLYAHGPVFLSQDLYKSLDAGAHWSAITPPSPPFFFHGLGAFTVSAANPSVLYASSWTKGFFKSTDGGATWSMSSGPGLESATQLVADPTNANNIYAADQHSVYQSTDGGVTWTTLLDSAAPSPNVINQLVLAPGDPSTLYVAVGTLNLLVPPDKGFVLRKTAGSQTFSTVFSGTSVNAIAINPQDANSGLAATSTGLFSFGNQPAVSLNQNTTAVAFSPSSPSTIFLGVFQDGIFKSTDGGATFQAAGLSPRQVVSFTTNPAMPSQVIASTENSSKDQFVTKFSADGSSVLYSSFLGGNSDELSPNMTIGADGTIYLAGTTTSNDFPITPNAWQAKAKTPLHCDRTGIGPPFVGSPFFGILPPFCANSYLTAIRPDGSAPIFSTYFGGSNETLLRGMTQDAAGTFYLAGETLAADLPVTPGAVRPHCTGTPCDDAFVSKFDHNGQLLAATYLGGSNHDNALIIAADTTGAAYVAGETFSSDFPVVKPFEGTCAIDPQAGTCLTTFLAKLNSNLSQISYSTYLNAISASAVAVDGAGQAYIVGTTTSASLPTVDPIQPIDLAGFCGSRDLVPCPDGFIIAFKPDGSEPLYSTYFGAGGGNQITGITLAADGSAFIAGWTNAADFPVTPDALQGKKNSQLGSNGFISKIKPDTLARQDFSFQLAQNSATIKSGSSAKFSFTLAPSPGGFFTDVVFSCSGLPAGASCSFSPGDVNPGVAPATVTLTINTAPAATASLHSAPARWSNPFGSALALGVIGLVFAGVRTKRNVKVRKLWLLQGAVVTSLLIISGCGGGSAPPRTPPPTNQPQSTTYTVAITGTAGAVQHSASVTLTVQ